MNIISQFIHRQSGDKRIGTVLFLFFLWVLALGFRSVKGQDDFDVFLNAGKRILSGLNIYGPPHYNDLKYYYSPLFALLLSPFSSMPLISVKLAWFLLNYICLVRSVMILKKYVSMNYKGSVFIILLVCICSGKVILYNIIANQLSILILWCLLESFRLYQQKRPVWSIILLCIGLNFKILPIVVLPFYLLVRPIRYKLLFPAVCIGLLYVPAFVIGWSYNAELLRGWWGNINPADQTHVVQISEQGFLDIGSLLTRYLSEAVVINETPVNIAQFNYQSIFLLVNICRLALLFLTIQMTRRLPEIQGVDSDLARLVPFLALIPLVLPHQRDYSFLFVFPMLLVLLMMLRQLGKTSLFFVFVFLILTSGILCWSSIVGSQIARIFYDYRLITIGMSGLLIMYLVLLGKFTQNNILISSQDVHK